MPQRWYGFLQTNAWFKTVGTVCTCWKRSAARVGVTVMTATRSAHAQLAPASDQHTLQARDNATAKPREPRLQYAPRLVPERRLLDARLGKVGRLQPADPQSPSRSKFSLHPPLSHLAPDPEFRGTAHRRTGQGPRLAAKCINRAENGLAVLPRLIRPCAKRSGVNARPAPVPLTSRRQATTSTMPIIPLSSWSTA
jgi:hypothetical protein